MPLPYVMFTDFKSIVKPKSAKAGDKSEIIIENEASGFWLFSCQISLPSQTTCNLQGRRCSWEFLNSLEREVRNINIFANPESLIMTEQGEKDYEAATTCWICKEKFGKGNKVRDFCHFTGKYRSAAHINCNLKLCIKPQDQNPNSIAQPERTRRRPLHAKNTQLLRRHHQHPKQCRKYISLSVGHLKFVDSFQCMATSLEKLVDATDKDDFKRTKTSLAPKQL